MWLAQLSHRIFGMGTRPATAGLSQEVAAALVGPEPTQPVDWRELWDNGELVHRSTGSICPFLGPAHLRALEPDVEKRKAQKYLLAQATPLDGPPLPSVFILAVPRPKHVDAFVQAARGVYGGTPGRRLLGSIGLLHANRNRYGWRVDFVQSHYNNSSAFPLKRSIATEYAGWTNRAMQALADHVFCEGTRFAFYGVTWVERDGVLVPQNTLSLSHFTSAFHARGFHVLHVGGSRRRLPLKHSLVVAARALSPRSRLRAGVVSAVGTSALHVCRSNEVEAIEALHRAIELGLAFL